MADGSSKPIAAVRVGDRIANSVPGDTTVQAHAVDRVIVTSTDHDFVDVAVKTSLTSRVKAAAAKAVAGAALAVVALTAGAGVANAAPADTPGPAAAAEVPASTVTTTFHHPFYDITQASFVDAVNLHTGDELQTTGGGETAPTPAVRAYHATEVTYDLTIDGLHTYYVEAGTTPVLVHNCGEEIVGNSHEALRPTQDWINPAKVDEYAASLRAGENVPPVEVQRLPNGKEYILDGHHRYVASMRTGILVDRTVTEGPGPVGLPDWSKVNYENWFEEP
jgi:hypothetical protein